MTPWILAGIAGAAAVAGSQPAGQQAKRRTRTKHTHGTPIKSVTSMVTFPDGKTVKKRVTKIVRHSRSMFGDRSTGAFLEIGWVRHGGMVYMVDRTTGYDHDVYYESAATPQKPGWKTSETIEPRKRTRNPTSKLTPAENVWLEKAILHYLATDGGLVERYRGWGKYTTLLAPTQGEVATGIFVGSPYKIKDAIGPIPVVPNDQRSRSLDGAEESFNYDYSGAKKFWGGRVGTVLKRLKRQGKVFTMTEYRKNKYAGGREREVTGWGHIKFKD